MNARRDVDPDAASVGLVAARWSAFDIPGGMPAVRLTRLDTDLDGGFTVVVRFPAGWQRPGPGSYDAVEEVFFLAGSFEMSGERYRAGDHAWLPAGVTRTASRSLAGAVALAWFSGPNRWAEGIAPSARVAERGFLRSCWTDHDEAPSPLGPPGRCLRSEDGRATWILEQLPEAVALPRAVATVSTFDLATHAYHRWSQDEQITTRSPGPVLARFVLREDAAGR